MSVFYGRIRRRSTPLQKQKSLDHLDQYETKSSHRTRMWRSSSTITESERMKFFRDRYYVSEDVDFDEDSENVPQRKETKGVLYYGWQLILLVVLKVISYANERLQGTFFVPRPRSSANIDDVNEEEGYFHHVGRMMFQYYVRFMKYFSDKHGTLLEMVMWLPLIIMCVYIVGVEKGQLVRW